MIKKIFDPINYHNFDHTKLEHNVIGWNGNNDIFKEIIYGFLAPPKNILELGTWYGQSAINMGHIIKDSNKNCNIICIDTWLGSLEFIGLHEMDPDRRLFPKYGYPRAFYQFLANIKYENLEDIIVPFPQTTTLGCKWLKLHNYSFDMIYVDGSNELSDVTNDIKFAWLLLEEGGIIFGDDYGHGSFPGVTMAVNKFTIDKNLKLIIKDNFWIIKKIHNE